MGEIFFSRSITVKPGVISRGSGTLPAIRAFAGTGGFQAGPVARPASRDPGRSLPESIGLAECLVVNSYTMGKCRQSPGDEL